MLSLILNPRFLLVSMIPYGKDRQVIESERLETVALIETYGGTAAEILSQNESHLNKGTFIGKGKADEITYLVEQEKIDVVVVNANLTASQLFALKNIIGTRSPNIVVWDRVDLILNIFKKHARTAEANLQIQLAETRHKGPELQGMGKNMSQQGAGVGSRGFGETQTEIMKRHWRAEIRQIEADLHKLTTSRKLQMEHRKRLGVPTLSLVGYTNAGKSTLFNLLTKKENLVQDAPFATLDSSVGKFYLHALAKEVYVTDTIGFIQDLSAELVDAFQSTLAETINADLLLHVIDCNDEFVYEKIETVEGVLADLEIAEKNRMYVFNKIDSMPPELFEKKKLRLIELYEDHAPHFVSAKTGEGMPELMAAIEQLFRSTKK